MELRIGGPITMKKYIKLSPEYKEEVKQYKENIANNVTSTKKPNANEKNTSRKHLQNYILISIWITLTKVNTNLF